jgi:hypothetical protein
MIIIHLNFLISPNLKYFRFYFRFNILIINKKNKNFYIKNFKNYTINQSIYFLTIYSKRICLNQYYLEIYCIFIF